MSNEMGESAPAATVTTQQSSRAENTGALGEKGFQLGTLRREHKGDDQLSELSRALVNHFFVLLRSASIYDLDNAALERPRESFLLATTGLHELLRAPLSLRLMDGNFFLNQRQLELDYGTYQNCRSLRRLMEFLRVNEVYFPPPIRAGDLEQLLTAFSATTRDQSIDISEQDSGQIRFRRLQVGKLHPRLQSNRLADKVMSWFACTFTITQRFVDDFQARRPLNFSRLKRISLDALQLPSSCWPILMVTSHFPQGIGSTARYMVDALALTTVLGGRLNLPAEERLLLCLVALQHSLLALSDEESALPNDRRFLSMMVSSLSQPPQLIAAARLRGVLGLTERTGLSDDLLQRLVLSFEIFRSREGGAPLFRTTRRGGELSRRIYQQPGLSAELSSELLRCVLFYLYYRQRMTPADALQALGNEESLSEDGVLLFNQLLGRFPVGSFVRLSDQQEALVVDFPQEGGNQPIVQRLNSPGELSDLGAFGAPRILGSVPERAALISYFFKR